MKKDFPQPPDKKKLSFTTHTPDKWDEVLAAFENDLCRRGRSDHTVSTYGYAMKGFGAFYRNQLKKAGPYVARIQEADMQAFIQHIHNERHLSATSVNRHIAALRAFSAFIWASGWHRRVLARDLKTRHVYLSKVEPPLSKSEVRRLVASVNPNHRNGVRDLAILQLLLQCGLRVSELVGLLRDDVLFSKGGRRLRVRKGRGRQERIIRFNTAVRQAMEDYLKSLGPVAGGSPLFLSERRQRLSIAGVQYLIKKYLAFAGREDLSARDLRHHFALKFYAKSGTLTATKEVLGLRDISTTARYARATEKEFQEAFHALDNRSE
jgi:site-specific recombinase XerD